jgi:long-chain acyl-CoA synthetase
MIFGKAKTTGEVPLGLAQTLEEISRRYKKREAIRFENRIYTYQELNEEASRVAGGLVSLGLGKGDRIALMLPNIPEFVFSFFGIQKIGAIVVPFNTMYKGREISFILQDSGAKAIICLSNFSNLIQEIQSECPQLEHVIITGQRTFVFVEPEGSVNIQLVFEKSRFPNSKKAFYDIGEALVDAFHQVGVSDAWYSHQGAIRASGKKLATILINEIENLYVCNIMTWLKPMDTTPLFKVLYVPPEIKERALEPMTSIVQESGKEISLDAFKDVLVSCFGNKLGVQINEGKLTRDELIAYEKNRALAGRLV